MTYSYLKWELLELLISMHRYKKVVDNFDTGLCFVPIFDTTIRYYIGTDMIRYPISVPPIIYIYIYIYIFIYF